MSTAINIRQPTDIGSGFHAITLALPGKALDRPTSPRSPPLASIGAVLEPAVKQQGQELRPMVSIKTGMPVMISPGDRRQCYGVCADDMLAPQEQYDAIKVYGLLREARDLALRKKATRARQLRAAVEAAGEGPQALALAAEAEEAEDAFRAEAEHWKQTRREVTTLLRNGTPAMAIICQFSADRIFLR